MYSESEDERDRVEGVPDVMRKTGQRSPFDSSIGLGKAIA